MNSETLKDNFHLYKLQGGLKYFVIFNISVKLSIGKNLSKWCYNLNIFIQ